MSAAPGEMREYSKSPNDTDSPEVISAWSELSCRTRMSPPMVPLVYCTVINNTLQ